MENNNVNVNENEKMMGGFDGLDAYVDWLNSDESDDLANAYAMAMEESENTNNKPEETPKTALSRAIDIVQGKDWKTQKAYIDLAIMLDERRNG